MKCKIALLGIIAVVGLLYWMSQTPVYGPGELDGFASCLNQSNAVMYGAYWCDHCAEQKRLFGSSFRFVKYVECDPRGANADPRACEAAGVQGYPLWVVNGTPYRGLVSLEELSRATGCLLNGSKQG